MIADVLSRGYGAVEFCWTIDGLRYPISTSMHKWDLAAHGWASSDTLQGLLDRRTLKRRTAVDPKRGDIQHDGMSFRVKDAWNNLISAQNPMTDLFGSAVSRANETELTATLSATALTADVVSTAAFAASGFFWIDQECIEYSGKNATQFTGLTRGMFGSRASEHARFVPAAEDIENGEPLIPSCFDRFIWSYGRRCTVWWAEILPDGTPDTPEIYWRGRLRDGPKAKGAETTWFHFEAEPMLAVADAPVLARKRSSPLTSIVIAGPQRVSWLVRAEAGAAWDAAGDFEFQGATTVYDDASDLVTRLVEAINTDIETDAVSDARLEHGLDLGNMLTFRNPVTDEQVRVELNGTLAYFFSAGARFDIVTGFAGIDTEVFLPFYAFGSRDPADGLVKVRVVDASAYSGLSPLVGDDYDVRATVAIGYGDEEITFAFVDIDVGTGILSLDGAFDFPTASFGDTDPTFVVETVTLEGSFVEAWKALIESTVGDDLKGYLYTDDFDWAAIRLAAGTGAVVNRKRTITEPTSFRKMWLEDLAFAGMLPTISGGKLSAIRFHAPLEIDADLTIDNDSLRPKDIESWARGRDRVINRMVFELRTEHHVGAFTPITYNIPHRKAQQALRVDSPREIKNFGVDAYDEDVITHVAAMTAEYLAVWAWDTEIVALPCTIRHAEAFPGQVARVTSEFLVNTSQGTRSLSNALVWISAVTLDPGTEEDSLTVDIEGFTINDGKRRSGWAPAAKISAYTDDGAGAGALRYRLTVTAGLYDSKQNEALYFKTGMKVEFREWNTETVNVESHTIAANGTAAGSIYISAPPSGGMQAIITAGNARLTLDSYNTANQTDEAQQYLHVCDETTGQIGGSGEDGFSPA